MPEITEVAGKPLKVLKNRKVLLYAGLGLGVGILVLAFKGLGGGSASSVTAPTSVVGGDQSISALGSQLQAFQSNIQDQQTSMVAQMVDLQHNSTSVDNVAPAVVAPRYVYGNTVDLASARTAFGDTGFKYINTEGMTSGGLLFGPKDIVVGGADAKGGIAEQSLNGATRLSGSNRADTSSAIINYQKNL